MTNEMFMLTNISCPICVIELEKAAQDLPGMKSVRVILGAGSINVEYDSKLLSQDQIRELCERMGVKVAKVIPAPSSGA